MIDYDKRIRALVIVDIALFALIALGIVFSPKSNDSRSTKRDLLANAANVASIQIAGQEPVTFARAGNSWTMMQPDGALPADGARVEAFLKAVDSVSRLEPVAKDTSSWARLGLEGESARSVTLADANGTAQSNFIVGNYAPSQGSVYIALASGPEAYIAASGMASYVLGKRASWLDLRAWTAPPAVEMVQEFSMRGAFDGVSGVQQAIDYTVTRSGSGWVSNGMVLDNAKVEALIRAFSTLRGEDYAPATEAAAASTTTSGSSSARSGCAWRSSTCTSRSSRRCTATAWQAGPTWRSCATW